MSCSYAAVAITRLRECRPLCPEGWNSGTGVIIVVVVVIIVVVGGVVVVGVVVVDLGGSGRHWYPSPMSLMTDAMVRTRYVTGEIGTPDPN